MKTFASIQKPKTELSLIAALLLLTWLTAFSQKPELVVQTGHTKGVFSVAFAPDGKTLASGSDGNIKLWNVDEGRELRTLDHEGIVQYVAFSPDGVTMATMSVDAIRIWDFRSGRELKKIEGTFLSISYSPDGRAIACAGVKNILMLDPRTGRTIRILADTASGNASSIAFSPDGKILASGYRDHSIKLWDIGGAQEPRLLTGHTSSIESVAFSHDGSILASGSFDGAIKLWNLKVDGNPVELAAADNNILLSLSFSPDDRTLAVCNLGEGTKLFDLRSHTLIRTLSNQRSVVKSVAFSRNGILASGSSDTTVKIWNTSNWQETRVLKGGTRFIFATALSRDSRSIATGTEDGTIQLWDLADARGMIRLRGHTGLIWALAFSPDGNILASASEDATIKLWDIRSGLELRTLIGHKYGVTAVAFSPDGKTIASGSSDLTVKLWPVNGGEPRTLNAQKLAVTDLAFLADGAKLVGAVSFSLNSITGDEPIKIWNLAKGREQSSDVDDTSNNRARLGLDRDTKSTKLVVQEHFEGKLVLSDRKTGAELCSLIALEEDNWLVVTPAGIFDGSPAAWNKIIWRFDHTTLSYVPVEAFFNEFYYPGLLQDVMNGKKPKPPVKDLSTIDIRQPQIDLTVIDGSSSGNRAAKVKVLVKNNRDNARQVGMTASTGAQDLRLFRNGSLVKVWHGDVLKGKDSVTLEATIPIVAGENNLTAYAFNRDNVKSGDTTLTVTGADSLKRKGVAYILAVGVNEYANAQYNLTYAVPDAKDFSAELKRQQVKLGNYDNVEVILLNDKDATKANILKALADLAAKIQPEDSLTVYFAGHGTAQQNRFYLIPHDLGYGGPRENLSNVGLQMILSHSISDEELEAALEGIDAGRLLMVIDACNSGQALEAEEKRRGPMNSKGLAQLAYEKGMYILTAAQSYQAAKEAAKLGHGFLTYALVEEGLKTAGADREPKDGQVLLREWLNFATERVPQMQQEDFKKRELTREKDPPPAQPKNAGSDNVQRPRVFYRRETESRPFVVARP